MTNHPVTPTHQLLQRWNNEAIMTKYQEPRYTEFIATRAAQWGADQELEACCEYLKDNELCDQFFYKVLHKHRRPKPPSLVEEALEAWERQMALYEETDVDMNTIRRALERLQELEDANG